MCICRNVVLYLDILAKALPPPTSLKVGRVEVFGELSSHEFPTIICSLRSALDASIVTKTIESYTFKRL